MQQVGLLEPSGLSYGRISKRLFIRPKTVISVCRAYAKRGGSLRPPGVHWRRGQLKLSQEARDWATHPNTLLRQAPLCLEARCREIRERFRDEPPIDPTTLRNYYKMAKIKFRQPLRNLDTTLSPVSRLSVMMQQQLISSVKTRLN